MSTLQARIILQILLPAAMGGVLALVTRPSGDVMLSNGATRAGPQPAPALNRTDKWSGKPGPGAFSPDSPFAEQQRFCERLQGASMEQMVELLNEAYDFADAARRSTALEIVLEQMAHLDPLAAWAFVDKWEEGHCRNEFLRAWGTVDAEGALSWAEAQGEAGEGYISKITSGLVPDDCEGFMTILPRLKSDQLDVSQLEAAFRSLAAEDSARALKLFELITPGGPRNAVANSMAEGWARRDAAGAYAWARTIADPAQRASALRGVFMAWAETDPERVAAKLDGLSNDSELKNAIGESPVRAVVRAWAGKNPKSAVAWLQGRSTSLGDRDFKQLLSAEILPARDKWSATELADILRKPNDKLVTERDESPYSSSGGWSSGDDENYTAIGGFAGWNSPFGWNGKPSEIPEYLRLADPAKAFDELCQQPGDASRQYVLELVASQWVAKDPKAALAKLQQTSDDWLKLGLINALSNHARNNFDPALATEVAKAFPRSTSRGTEMVFEIYQSLAQREPERALALLESDIDPANKSGIASTLAAQQASYDPDGALAWAARQKDESLQIAATRSAMWAWAQADAYAASEWLTAQPAGPMREAAVRSLVGALGESSPEDAIRWAASLADPQQREQEQMSIVQNTLSSDPQKAKQLAEMLQVSGEKKKRLEQMIQEQETNRR